MSLHGACIPVARQFMYLPVQHVLTVHTNILYIYIYPHDLRTPQLASKAHSWGVKINQNVLESRFVIFEINVGGVGSCH